MLKRIGVALAPIRSTAAVAGLATEGRAIIFSSLAIIMRCWTKTDAGFSLDSIARRLEEFYHDTLASQMNGSLHA